MSAAVRAPDDDGLTIVRAADLEDGDTIARWLVEPLWSRAAVGVLGTILAEGPPGDLGNATRRYRVAWRDADGTPHERETEDHHRQPRPRRSASPMRSARFLTRAIDAMRW